MFKNLSIQIKLQIIVFFTILAVTMIVSFQAIYTMNKISMEEVQSFKKETYKAKEKELQNYIDIAYKTLEAFYKKIDDEGLEGADVTIVKQEAIKAIQNIKFGENGYFWINTLDGYMVLNPANPTLNGKEILSIQDKKGKYFFKDMISLVKKDNEGLIQYEMNKPGDSKSYPKYSYVKKFEKWGWMVGTGAYVDNIEKHINEMKAETDAETKGFIITLIICSVITILVLNFFLYLVTRKIIAQPLVNFELGLLGFFKYLNREKDEVQELEIKSHDEIGIMAKVVNDNIKITKKGVEEDRALIDETISVLGEFEQGDLCQRLNMEVSNPALNELKNVLNKMGENMEHNIDNVLNILEQYTHYNYLDKIECKGLKEHLYRLATGVNDLGDSITQMLVENKSNGLTLDDTSDILVENMDQLNKASTEAAASLEETAAALEEITGNIRSNTQNVVKMSNFANEITLSSKKGEQLASQTTNSMQEINDQVTAINEAIAVIDQIAFQTNILSLNAAVEAATAGEAGKGFAVVAQEVRNLASRSAEAAKEIKDIVEIATSKANEGKEIAQDMIEGYSSLNENIVKTTDLIKDVETGSKEQQSGIEQINDAINQLDQQTQANVSIANSTQVVAEETDFLAKLVVSNANEKNFHGKNEVKAKKMNLGTKKNVKTEPQISQKQIKEEKKTITSNNTSSESEWESF